MEFYVVIDPKAYSPSLSLSLSVITQFLYTHNAKVYIFNYNTGRAIKVLENYD